MVHTTTQGFELRCVTTHCDVAQNVVQCECSSEIWRERAQARRPVASVRTQQPMASSSDSCSDEEELIALLLALRRKKIKKRPRIV